MQETNGFFEMVAEDIKLLDRVSSMSLEEKYKFHRKLDARYQACVKDWLRGFWGVYNGEIYYNEIVGCDETLSENLEMMKGKLETFSYQMNMVRMPEVSSTHVSVTTNVNINLTFEEVRNKIEDMTALGQRETDEILKRIDELEQISKENSSRKSKWEKVKPIISFVMDKGADVAVAILTLIVQMKLGI